MTAQSRNLARTRPLWITLGVIAALIIAGVWWFAATRAEGSKGASPSALPAGTEMGVVELAVQDLGTTTAYYRDALGLAVLEETDEQVVLGNETPLIRLETSADGPQDPRSAGLYHSAILYPDAASLAQTLVRLAQNAPESYQGSADHAVSLAFYAGDPEGNGVELYIDRPREDWVWEDGLVQMGSAPLDPNQFIAENLDAEASGDSTMGHVHLRVGDLERARAFYEDALGFAVTAEANGALFYAAGGYHHHLATNIWQSAGAGERDGSAGLRGITVSVPAASDLDALAERLSSADVEYELSDGRLTTADPWGNVVRFVTR